MYNIFNVHTSVLHNYAKEILAALLLKFQEKRQNLSRQKAIKKLKRFRQPLTGFFNSCICKEGFSMSIKIIHYDPTQLPEGKGERAMVAGPPQGIQPAVKSTDTHRSSVRLSLWLPALPRSSGPLLPINEAFPSKQVS